MEQPDLQNLKYGIIYLYSDRKLSPGIHNAEAIIEKFVYPMQVQWINQPGRNDLFLIARRFNVGNIGQYATVSLTLSRMNRSGGWFEAIRHFADTLMGISDVGDGDILLNENDYGYRYFDQSSVFGDVYGAAPQDHTMSEPASLKGRLKLFKKKLDHLAYEVDEDKCVPLPQVTSDKVSTEAEDDPIQEAEICEVERLEQEREKALERIKRDIVNYIAHYHDDPKNLIAELLRGKVVVGQPGRVLVNGDMRIVLPEYDEMEIEMPAMCRTLYILFMKQRKVGSQGIILKNMDEFRDEIMDIYRLVKPGANDLRIEQSVNNLCDPLSDSLHQAISRINRCIRLVITDKQLAQQYTITGTRGEPYCIALPPERLELPRAVTDAKT